MSNPSFSNIDLWLFELAEGNLTAEQIEQLEAFMIRHPELEVDRDVWEMTKIKSSEIQYPYQNKLSDNQRNCGKFHRSSEISYIRIRKRPK